MRSWWNNTVIYHIYLPSFKDGNSDGIGDFKGLMSSLDYFDHLNARTLLLSPFYPSPLKDNGYDISDYVNVDPIYGTLRDFDAFMTEVKKRDLHVVIDLVGNHTSDQHPWFLKSVKKEEPYKDYYTWVDPIHDGDRILPPNNWLSVFDGSAWTFNEKRGQFYLHQFLPEQPDLDWNNPKVREEINKVMRFWLDRGVGGFRVDAVCHFMEDQRLLDEPVAVRTKCKPNEYSYLDHIYTKGLKTNLQLVKGWRDLLNEYEEITGEEKIILTEAYEDVEDLIEYYGDSETRLADVPFNVTLLDIKASSTAQDLFKTITSWLDAMPGGKWPNWILGNHDQGRFASRVGSDLVTGLHMVTALLPGILFCYYGDELGMENCKISEEDTRDSFALRTTLENSRDPSRTPMQWNDEKNAGFTDAEKPWLPVNENYKIMNVKHEQTTSFSVLDIYCQLLALRGEPSIKSGILEFPFIDGNVFSMIRVKPGIKSFLIVLNMGKSLSIVDFSDTSLYLPKSGYLELSNNKLRFERSPSLQETLSKNIPNTYLSAIQLCSTEGQLHKIYFDNIILLPREAIVVGFMPRETND